MKVICDRGVLVEALNMASAAVVSRTPKPVLQCILLTAGDGTLSLASTDLEVALSLVIHQVQVQEAGQTLVPADKFSSIVRESVDQTISIESDGETTQVRGEDSHFKIYGQPVKDFPPVTGFEGEPDFLINAQQLQQLIERTIFATARETSRYAINGVLVERDGKKLTLVATDGRRLALARGTCTDKGPGANVIIPTKALTLLTKLLTDPDENVKVKVAGNQAIFGTESAALTTNLIEGNFPPYRDVIPKEQDRTAVFNSEVLRSGVRRASLLTNEESKGVKFAFGPKSLVLTSRAPEMGEAEVTVPVDSYTGEPVEIGFNPHFVSDALKVANSEHVTLEFKASNKPGVLKAGTDFVYIIMPVSLA